MTAADGCEWHSQVSRGVILQLDASFKKAVWHHQQQQQQHKRQHRQQINTHKKQIFKPIFSFSHCFALHLLLQPSTWTPDPDPAARLSQDPQVC